MRLPQPLPARAEAELTQLLDRVETKADYRRVLCVWLRAALGCRLPRWPHSGLAYEFRL